MRKILRLLLKRLIFFSSESNHKETFITFTNGERIHKCAVSTGRPLMSSIPAQIQSAECLLLSFMTWKWQTTRQLPGHFPHSACGTWTLLTWRTSRACSSLSEHLQDKYLRWSRHKKKKKATCPSFGVQLRSFCSKLLFLLEGTFCSFILLTLNYSTFKLWSKSIIFTAWILSP